MSKTMKTTEIEPFVINDPNTPQSTPPINAFCQDYFHVGTNLGNNVTVMEGVKTKDENIPYIIIINRLTGERLKVEFFGILDNVP